MKLKALLLITFLLFAGWTWVYAQDGAESYPEPVILNDEQDEYPLGLYLELLEDPSRELTIEDVSSPEYADQFLPNETEVPNLGYSDSAYWVRLPLRNESRLTQWFLDVGWANIQYVDFYAPGEDDAEFTGIETGIFRPPANRDTPSNRFIFDLSIPTQGEQTYYLRFQSGGSITLPLSLWTPAAMAGQIQKEQMQEGIFFGVMLALLFYNLFLFFSLRDRSYLYLLLFMANWIFFEAVYSGYLEMYILPNFYYLRRYYQPITFALIFITGILFSDTFLETRNRLPRLHTANLVVLGAWGFLLILTPFVPYSYLARMMVPWALPTLLIILTAGILSWRHGFQPARFFLFAWFGLIIPLAIVILVRIGAIPSTTWTENAYHIGVMWMAVSWSVALADRINLLKTEIENANRDLLNSKNRLAQILDGLPLGVAVYGRDSKPNFTNRRALEILGNPAQGIEPGLSAGRTLSQAMHYFSFRIAGSDEAYPLKKMPVQSALQGQADSADDIEADLVDKRVPLEIWASPVLDEAGDVDSAVVAFQDITLRRQAEEAQRASEERFRVIVENVFDGIAFLDRDRTILYVSPSYKQLNGIDPEEMIGKSGAGTIHTDDRTYVAATFQRLLEQPGGRVSEEYRIRHKDGSWVWVETRVMNLLDDPRVGAIVLNSRDITQRKQSESALAEYRAHLEQLVEIRTAELSATNEWLSLLKRIRQMVGGTADLPKVCDRLLTTSLKLFDARLAFLLRCDDQGEHFEVECLRGREVDSIKTPEELAFIVANMPPYRQELIAGEPVRLSDEKTESMPDEIRDLFQKYSLQTILLKPVTGGHSTEAVFGIVLQQPLQDITEAEVELIRTVGLDLFSLIEGAELLDRAQALLVAEERNSLARDLHDSVTQILFSASVLAESIPRLWDKNEAIARMNLEKLSVLLRGALADMRSLLFELRSDVTQDHSLEKLLIALVDSTRARTQLDFTLKVSHEPELPADVAQVFYRIAREALNNVVKHADATRVSITLFNEADCAELHIEDNGRGFNPQEIDAGHMGISIMAERAATINADLRIKSEAGHGSEVLVTWPGNGAELLNDG